MKFKKKYLLLLSLFLIHGSASAEMYGNGLPFITMPFNMNTYQQSYKSDYVASYNYQPNSTLNSVTNSQNTFLQNATTTQNNASKSEVNISYGNNTSPSLQNTTTVQNNELNHFPRTQAEYIQKQTIENKAKSEFTPDKAYFDSISDSLKTTAYQHTQNQNGNLSVYQADNGRYYLYEDDKKLFRLDKSYNSASDISLRPSYLSEESRTIGTEGMKKVYSIDEKYVVNNNLEKYLDLGERELQVKNECEIVSLSTILRYYGIKMDKRALKQVWKDIPSQKGLSLLQGTVEGSIKDVANLYGFEVTINPYDQNTVQNLKNEINAGKPVIVVVKSHVHETMSHAMVLRGYNDKTQTFSVFDPRYATYQQMEYDLKYRSLEPLDYDFNFYETITRK